MIITESVIDAAALWSAGLRNVIPVYGVTGFTEEIMAHLTRFHLDTIDLYQARATVVCTERGELCGVSEQQVSADLLQLIEKLEAARLAMRRNGDEQNHHEAPMTLAERDAALQYLKDPKLTERIVEDFRKCGLVGERATVLTM